MAPFRTLAPVVALTALALPGLSACSSASSGSASSSASTSAPTTLPSVTVTGTPALPSVDAAELTAIGTCLKNAGLPTPTSTAATAGAAELVRLLRDPTTAAALRACGIPIPSGSLSTSSS